MSAKTYGRPRPLPEPVADRELVFGLATIAVPLLLGALLWVGILELALHHPMVLALGVGAPLVLAYFAGWLSSAFASSASRSRHHGGSRMPGVERTTEAPGTYARSEMAVRSRGASTPLTGRSAGSSGSPALPQKPVAH